MNSLKHASLLTFAALSTVLAQAPGRGAAPAPLAIREVKPGFYMVTGAGANSGVRVTGLGMILVDGKLGGAGNYDALMTQIRSVSKEPIRSLIVTHHHVDHTGNNANFLTAGVAIIAHENLNTNLTTYAVTPVPPAANITYAKDYTARVGTAQAQVFHFGRGHTSGDSVVFFPDVKVIMLSDVVTTGTTGPLVDYAGGGSALEWPKVLDAVLKLDWDTAIPGNGEPLTKADVRAYKTKFETLLGRAKELIGKGTPKEQLLAGMKTDDIGFNFRLNGAALDGFISELSAK